MTTLNIQAITENGSTVYGSIKVNNDYTMNEVVETIKSNGFVKFRLTETMKVFVDIA